MRLSTRSRYGTRLMLQLALNYNMGNTLLKDIAKEEDISEKYLSQLVILLKANGLINSSRGAHGGYRLAKPPSLITIEDIVKTLEGNLSPVECIKNPSVCRRAPACVTRDVWEILDEKISDTLNSITLKDLIKQRSEQKKDTTKQIG